MKLYLSTRTLGSYLRNFSLASENSQNNLPPTPFPALREASAQPSTRTFQNNYLSRNWQCKIDVYESSVTDCPLINSRLRETENRLEATASACERAMQARRDRDNCSHRLESMLSFETSYDYFWALIHSGWTPRGDTAFGDRDGGRFSHVRHKSTIDDRPELAELQCGFECQ